MNSWYIRSREGELGPFTAPEMQFLIRTGAVSKDDLVRPGDTSIWMQLGDSHLTYQSTTAIPVNAPESGSDAVVPDLKKSPEHSDKFSKPIVPECPNSSPVPQVLSRERIFHPNHGLAAAAVVILLMAILALLRMVALPPTIPFHRSSSDNEPDAEHAPQQPLNARQSVARVVTDPPQQHHEDPGASATSVPNEHDGPVEAPNPIPPPAATPSTDENTKSPIASDQRFETGLPSVSRSNVPDAHQLPHRETVPSLQGSDLRGRSIAGRAAAIANSGGDEDSERSVAMALEWLKSIQQEDGSWDFQKVGHEAQSGTLRSNSAATTLAVLCFLGAGNTTTSGPDEDTVSRAFTFLEREAAEASSRQPETLYVSALAMIAFSELAAMDPTNSRAKSIAASLLTFLQQSQDHIGGGWRYSPSEPGDLSVTGWQIMALQSARTCGLDVSPVTIARCSTFVDSVSFAGGSEYSYTPTTRPTPCMSAVGLLSRIYLGSPKQSAFFDSGFQKLTAAGPDPNNIYFNYYASIALHHYGGPLWNDWNSSMRPLLVSQQISTGPARGSWALRDQWGKAGGQIYQTCLSTLCLEVYYRYLPMFATSKVAPTEKQEKP